MSFWCINGVTITPCPHWVRETVNTFAEKKQKQINPEMWGSTGGLDPLPPVVEPPYPRPFFPSLPPPPFPRPLFPYFFRVPPPKILIFYPRPRPYDPRPPPISKGQCPSFILLSHHTGPYGIWYFINWSVTQSNLFNPFDTIYQCTTTLEYKHNQIELWSSMSRALFWCLGLGIQCSAIKRSSACN